MANINENATIPMVYKEVSNKDLVDPTITDTLKNAKPNVQAYELNTDTDYSHNNIFQESIYKNIGPNEAQHELAKDLSIKAQQQYQDLGKQYSSTYQSMLSTYGSYKDIPLEDRAKLKKMKVAIKTFKPTFNTNNVSKYDIPKLQYYSKLMSNALQQVYSDPSVNTYRNDKYNIISFGSDGSIHNLIHNPDNGQVDIGDVTEMNNRNGLQELNKGVYDNNININKQLSSIIHPEDKHTNPLMKALSYMNSETMYGVSSVSKEFTHLGETVDMELGYLTGSVAKGLGFNNVADFANKFADSIAKDTTAKARMLKDLQIDKVYGILDRVKETNLLTEKVSNEVARGNYLEAIKNTADGQLLLDQLMNSTGEMVAIANPTAFVAAVNDRSILDVNTRIQKDPSINTSLEAYKLYAESMAMNATVLKMEQLLGEYSVISRHTRSLTSNSNKLFSKITDKEFIEPVDNTVENTSNSLLSRLKQGVDNVGDSIANAKYIGKPYRLTRFLTKAPTKAFIGEGTQETLDQAQQTYIQNGKLDKENKTQLITAGLLGGASGVHAHIAFHPITQSALVGAGIIGAGIVALPVMGALAYTQNKVNRYIHNKGINNLHNNIMNMLPVDISEEHKSNISKTIKQAGENAYNLLTKPTNDNLIKTLDDYNNLRQQLSEHNIDGVNLSAISGTLQKAIIKTAIKNGNNSTQVDIVNNINKMMIDINENSSSPEEAYTAIKRVLSDMLQQHNIEINDDGTLNMTEDEMNSALEDETIDPEKQILLILAQHSKLLKSILTSKNYQDYSKTVEQVNREFMETGHMKNGYALQALNNHMIVTDAIADNTSELDEEQQEAQLTAYNRFLTSRTRNKALGIIKAILQVGSKYDRTIFGSILKENTAMVRHLKNLIDTKFNGDLNEVFTNKDTDDKITKKLKHIARHIVNLPHLDDNGNMVVFDVTKDTEGKLLLRNKTIIDNDTMYNNKTSNTDLAKEYFNATHVNPNNNDETNDVTGNAYEYSVGINGIIIDENGEASFENTIGQTYDNAVKQVEDEIKKEEEARAKKSSKGKGNSKGKDKSKGKKYKNNITYPDKIKPAIKKLINSIIKYTSNMYNKVTDKSTHTSNNVIFTVNKDDKESTTHILSISNSKVESSDNILSLNYRFTEVGCHGCSTTRKIWSYTPLSGSQIYASFSHKDNDNKLTAINKWFYLFGRFLKDGKGSMTLESLLSIEPDKRGINKVPIIYTTKQSSLEDGDSKPGSVAYMKTNSLGSDNIGRTHIQVIHFTHEKNSNGNFVTKANTITTISLENTEYSRMSAIKNLDKVTNDDELIELIGHKNDMYISELKSIQTANPELSLKDIHLSLSKSLITADHTFKAKDGKKQPSNALFPLDRDEVEIGKNLYLTGESSDTNKDNKDSKDSKGSKKKKKSKKRLKTTNVTYKYDPERVEKEAEKNPHKLFLFGDNVEKHGTGFQVTKTQAIIRHLKNAFGISTKHTMRTDEDAFMTIDELKESLAKEMKELKEYLSEHTEITELIVPKNEDSKYTSIGSGKAIENNPKLSEEEKKEFSKLIQEEIDKLVDEVNEESSTKSKDTSKASTWSDIYNNSGGATGADTFIADVLTEVSNGEANNIHHSYKGAFSKVKALFKHPTKTLISNLKKINTLFSKPGIGYDNDGKDGTFSIKLYNENGKINHGRALNARNYEQVDRSDTIIAIAPLAKAGTPKAKDHNWKLKTDGVLGGTGVAVELAKGMGKDIYVYNNEDSNGFDKGWFKYNKDTKTFEPVNVKDIEISNTFAGIGSREVDNYSTEVKAQLKEDLKTIFNNHIENSKSIDSIKEELFKDSVIDEESIDMEEVIDNEDVSNLNIYNDDEVNTFIQENNNKSGIKEVFKILLKNISEAKDELYYTNTKRDILSDKANKLQETKVNALNRVNRVLDLIKSKKNNIDNIMSKLRAMVKNNSIENDLTTSGLLVDFRKILLKAINIQQISDNFKDKNVEDIDNNQMNTVISDIISLQDMVSNLIEQVEKIEC